MQELAQRWHKLVAWLTAHYRKRDDRLSRRRCAYCRHFYGIGLRPGAHLFRGVMHSDDS